MAPTARHTLIARNASRVRDLVLALIVARVIDAQSKLATARALAPESAERKPMIKQCVAVVFMTALVMTLAPVPAAAQNEQPMRTPDGQPDISGIFTFRTLTPFQRPRQFEGQETLSAEEAAEFEASERTRQNRDLFDPETGARSAGYQPRAEGGVLSYNEFWYERGVDLTDDKRTSLIIDPPDGRMPPRVPRPPDAQPRRQLSREEATARRYESKP